MDDYKRFSEVLYCGEPQEIYAEVRNIVKSIDDDFDLTFIDKVFQDILLLFQGKYPGFQASKTKYHDLSHTCWVVLALVRLVHGHALDGRSFSCRVIGLGILTAFFHDVGLIQKDEETGGTGAKFTIGHEERSVAILLDYLTENGQHLHDFEEIEQIIQCTGLSKAPGDIYFESEEVKLMGFMLGSADLLAQMAERTYLEKLPLLFEEFQEGQVPGFDSSFDLFKKTESFYRDVVLNRLHNDMDGVSESMKMHFKSRWNLDRNLYEEAINNQIAYLKKITIKCQGNYECLLGGLRRRG